MRHDRVGFGGANADAPTEKCEEATMLCEGGNDELLNEDPMLEELLSLETTTMPAPRHSVTKTSR